MNIRSKVKRILSLVVALAVLIPVTLAARPIAITWDWFVSDPDVQYFRYQLNGEEEEGWTVVGADVASYTSDTLDGSVSHALYLQQSYDGEVWSESAVSSVAALFPVEQEPAEPLTEETPASSSSISLVGEVPVEEPVAEAVVEPVLEEAAPEPAPVITAVEPAPVEEASPVVASVAVAAPVAYNATKSGVDIKLGAVYGLIDPSTPDADRKDYDRLIPGIELNWRVDNALKLGGRMGLGFQLGGFYEAHLASAASTLIDTSNRFSFATKWFETGAWDDVHHVYGLSLAPRFSFAFSEKTSLVLVAGGRVMLSTDALSPQETLPAVIPLIGNQSYLGLNYSVGGSLEFRHNFSKGFGLGLGLDYDYLFGVNNRHSFGASLIVSIGN